MIVEELMEMEKWLRGGCILKVWIKMLIVILLGTLLAFFIPLDQEEVHNFLSFFSEISLNILLYFTVIYTAVKLYTGTVNWKQTEKPLAKTIFIFFLCVILFLFFSAAVSIFVMNITPLQQERLFDFNQKSSYRMELFTFSDLCKQVFPDNGLSVLMNGTVFFSPVILFAAVLALGTIGAGRKGQFFYDIVKSFGDILDAVVIQIVEFTPFFSLFIMIFFVRYGFIEVTNPAVIIWPVIAIVIVSLVLLGIISLFLKFFFKGDILGYYMAAFGAALIGFVTGHTLSTVVPLNLHLKKNLKIDEDLVDFLVPIGTVLNNTGTVIVSTVVLVSIIIGYSLNILTLNLQVAIFFLVVFFSFRLDGNHEFTFLVLIAMIFKEPSLHLEETSYLLFIALAPLFSRIAVFLNVFTTGIYTLLTARYVSSVGKVEFRDYL